MTYRVTVYDARGKTISQSRCDGIGAARNEAQQFVEDRMDAFGDDREALQRYGYIDAEDQALALGEDGGTVYLPDNWRIEVTPDKL